MPDRLNLQKIFSAPDVKHGRQLPTEDLNKLKNLQVPILFKKVQ